jgi:hypothetical protein
MNKTLGKVAFEAYVSRVGGETYDKKPIPEWQNLSESVKDGWEAAAAAVVKGRKLYPVMQEERHD